MKRLTIITVLALIINCSAQNFRLGFSSESYKISVNGVYDKQHEKVYPLYSLYLVSGLKFNDFLILENRTGFLFEGYGYDGLETGLFAKLTLIDKLIYISPGFVFHFNYAAERTFSSNNSDVIRLLSIGLGFNFSRTGFIEVLFQKPLNNIFGSYIDDINYDPSVQVVYKPMRIHYLLKFGFGFAWNL
jgi:hypothetical protein